MSLLGSLPDHWPVRYGIYGYRFLRTSAPRLAAWHQTLLTLAA